MPVGKKEEEAAGSGTQAEGSVVLRFIGHMLMIMILGVPDKSADSTFA